jgi:hypothetical protein
VQVFLNWSFHFYMLGQWRNNKQSQLCFLLIYCVLYCNKFQLFKNNH